MDITAGGEPAGTIPRPALDILRRAAGRSTAWTSHTQTPAPTGARTGWPATATPFSARLPPALLRGSPGRRAAARGPAPSAAIAMDHALPDDAAPPFADVSIEVARGFGSATGSGDCDGPELRRRGHVPAPRRPRLCPEHRDDERHASGAGRSRVLERTKSPTYTSEFGDDRGPRKTYREERMSAHELRHRREAPLRPLPDRERRPGLGSPPGVPGAGAR